MSSIYNNTIQSIGKHPLISHLVCIALTVATIAISIFVLGLSTLYSCGIGATVLLSSEILHLYFCHKFKKIKALQSSTNIQHVAQEALAPPPIPRLVAQVPPAQVPPQNAAEPAERHVDEREVEVSPSVEGDVAVGGSSAEPAIERHLDESEVEASPAVGEDVAVGGSSAEPAIERHLDESEVEASPAVGGDAAVGGSSAEPAIERHVDEREVEASPAVGGDAAVGGSSAEPAIERHVDEREVEASPAVGGDAAVGGSSAEPAIEEGPVDRREEVIQVPDDDSDSEWFNGDVFSTGSNDRLFTAIHADNFVRGTDLEGVDPHDAEQLMELFIQRSNLRNRASLLRQLGNYRIIDASLTKDDWSRWMKTDYTLLACGWTGHPAHAMLCEIRKKDRGDVEICFFNTGDGLQYHQSTVRGGKRRFYPCRKYEIPRNKVGSFLWDEFFKTLVEFETAGHREFSSKQFYDFLGIIFEQNGIRASETVEYDKFFLSQYSGTCSWKVLTAWLKCQISKEEWLKFKLNYKYQTLVGFYNAKKRHWTDPRSVRLLKVAAQKLRGEILAHQGTSVGKLRKIGEILQFVKSCEKARPLNVYCAPVDWKIECVVSREDSGTRGRDDIHREIQIINELSPGNYETKLAEFVEYIENKDVVNKELLILTFMKKLSRMKERLRVQNSEDLFKNLYRLSSMFFKTCRVNVLVCLAYRHIGVLLDVFLEQSVAAFKGFSVQTPIRAGDIVVDPEEEMDLRTSGQESCLDVSSFEKSYAERRVVPFEFLKKLVGSEDSAAILRALNADFDRDGSLPPDISDLSREFVWAKKIIFEVIHGARRGGNKWEYEDNRFSLRDFFIDGEEKVREEYVSQYREVVDSYEIRDEEDILGRKKELRGVSDHYETVWHMPYHKRSAVYAESKTSQVHTALTAISHYTSNIDSLVNLEDRQALWLSLFYHFGNFISSGNVPGSSCSRVLEECDLYHETLQNFIRIGCTNFSSNPKMRLFFLRLGAVFYRYAEVYRHRRHLDRAISVPDYRKEIRSFVDSRDYDDEVKSMAHAYLVESYGNVNFERLSEEQQREMCTDIVKARIFLSQVGYPKELFESNRAEQIMIAYSGELDNFVQQHPDILAEIFGSVGEWKRVAPFQYQEAVRVVDIYSGEVFEDGDQFVRLPIGIRAHFCAAMNADYEGWKLTRKDGGDVVYEKEDYSILNKRGSLLLQRTISYEGRRERYSYCSYPYARFDIPLIWHRFNWWSNDSRCIGLDSEGNIAVVIEPDGRIYRGGRRELHLNKSSLVLSHCVPQDQWFEWQDEKNEAQLLEVPSMNIAFTCKDGRWELSSFPGFYISERRVDALKRYEHALVVENDRGEVKVILPLRPFERVLSKPSFVERTFYARNLGKSTDRLAYVVIDVRVNGRGLIETDNSLFNIVLAYFSFVEKHFDDALYYLDKCRPVAHYSSDEAMLFFEFFNVRSAAHYDNGPNAVCCRLHVAKTLLDHKLTVDGEKPNIDVVLEDYLAYLRIDQHVTVRKLTIDEELEIVRYLLPTKDAEVVARAIEFGLVKEGDVDINIHDEDKDIVSGSTIYVVQRYDGEWEKRALIPYGTDNTFLQYEQLWLRILQGRDELLRRRIMLRVMMMRFICSDDFARMAERILKAIHKPSYHLPQATPRLLLAPQEISLPGVMEMESMAIPVASGLSGSPYVVDESVLRPPLSIGDPVLDRQMERFSSRQARKLKLSMEPERLREELLRIIGEQRGLEEKKRALLIRVNSCSISGVRRHRSIRFNELLHLFAASDVQRLVNLTELNRADAEAVFSEVREWLKVATYEQKIVRALKLLDQISAENREVFEEQVALSLEADHQYDVDSEIGNSLLVFEYHKNILLRKEQIDILNKFLEGDPIVLQAIMGTGKTEVILPILLYLKRGRGRLPIALVPSALLPTNYEHLNATCRDSFGQEIFTFTYNRQDKDEKLVLILDVLRRAIRSKAAIVVTQTTMLNLCLAWRERLAQGEENGELREIIAIFKERGDVIVDEADHILEAIRAVYFEMGVKEAVDPDIIRGIWDVFKLLFNYYALTDESEWGMVAEVCETWYRVPKDYLLGKTHSLPPGKTDAEKKRAATMRALFTVYLKVAKDKKAHIHYGLSKEHPDQLFAMPYGGNNKPCEGSQFANVYEIICYTILYYLTEGVTVDQIVSFVSGERSKIMLQVRSGEISLEQTRRYKDLQQIFNYDGNDLFDKDREFFEQYVHDMGFIEYFLCEIVLPSITTCSKQISGTSHTLVSMFSRLAGFTGTTWNVESFPRWIVPRIDDSVNGKTLYLLDSRKEEGKVHLIEEEKVEEVIGKIGSESYNALIDVGGLFRGILNRAVAELLLNRMAEEIQGIVFFDDRSNMLVCLERNGHLVPLRDCTIPLQNRFTYYDQRHTIGADIAQYYSAKALVTFSEHTMLKDLLQAVGRMRQLEYKQTVEFVCARRLFEGQDVVTVEDIVRNAWRLEQRRLGEEVFRAMLQGVDHEEMSYAMRIGDYGALVQEGRIDPFADYGGEMGMVNTRAMLELRLAQAKNRGVDTTEVEGYVNERLPFAPPWSLDFRLGLGKEVQREVEREVEMNVHVQDECEYKWFRSDDNPVVIPVNDLLGQTGRVSKPIFSAKLMASSNMFGLKDSSPKLLTHSHRFVHSLVVLADSTTRKLKKVIMIFEGEKSRLSELYSLDPWYMVSVGSYPGLFETKGLLPEQLSAEGRKELEQIRMEVDLINGFRLEQIVFVEERARAYKEWLEEDDEHKHFVSNVIGKKVVVLED